MKKFALVLFLLAAPCLAVVQPKGYPRPQASAGPVLQDLWDRCFAAHEDLWGPSWPCPMVVSKPSGTQAPHLYTWATLPSPSEKRALAARFHCPGTDTHCTAPLYYIAACEVPAPPPTEPTISQVNMDPSKFDTFVGFLCGAHVRGYRGRDGINYAFMDQFQDPRTPTPPPPTATATVTATATSVPATAVPSATATALPAPSASPTVQPSPTNTPHFQPAPTTTAPPPPPTVTAAAPAPTPPPTPGHGCGGATGIAVGTAIAAAVVARRRYRG